MSEQMLKDILDELKRVRNDQNVTNQNISNIKGTMATKEELNVTNQNISNIKETMATKDELDVMNQNIFNIKETMATKEDVADVPHMKTAIFEILDVVNRLESTQERQERTLDLLSRRSIDQEAEIKRMKLASRAW